MVWWAYGFVLSCFNFNLLYPAVSILKCWFSFLEQTPTDIRMSHLKSMLQDGKIILFHDGKFAKNVHLITIFID